MCKIIHMITKLPFLYFSKVLKVLLTSYFRVTLKQKNTHFKLYVLVSLCPRFCNKFFRLNSCLAFKRGCSGCNKWISFLQETKIDVKKRSNILWHLQTSNKSSKKHDHPSPIFGGRRKEINHTLPLKA